MESEAVGVKDVWLDQAIRLCAAKEVIALKNKRRITTAGAETCS